MADQKKVTEVEVTDALNRAIDDIDDEVGLPESGARDALNLLTNTVLHRLFVDRAATLTAVCEAAYPDTRQEIDDGLHGPDVTEVIEVVAEWIGE